MLNGSSVTTGLIPNGSSVLGFATIGSVAAGSSPDSLQHTKSSEQPASEDLQAKNVMKLDTYFRF